MAEEKIIDVFVCKIRRKVKKFGIKIQTSWGQGWYMDAENKARTRGYMQQNPDGRLDESAA